MENLKSMKREKEKEKVTITEGHYILTEKIGTLEMKYKGEKGSPGS